MADLSHSFPRRLPVLDAWARLDHWIRKFACMAYGNKQPDAEIAAVCRLAQTAPHLLADLGFVRAAFGPEQETWRRDDLTVHLFVGATDVVVTRGVRG